MSKRWYRAMYLPNHGGTIWYDFEAYSSDDAGIYAKEHGMMYNWGGWVTLVGLPKEPGKYKPGQPCQYGCGKCPEPSKRGLFSRLGAIVFSDARENESGGKRNRRCVVGAYPRPTGFLLAQIDHMQSFEVSDQSQFIGDLFKLPAHETRWEIAHLSTVGRNFIQVFSQLFGQFLHRADSSTTDKEAGK